MSVQAIRKADSVGAAKSAMVSLPAKVGRWQAFALEGPPQLGRGKGSRVDESAALSRRRVGDALTMSIYPKLDIGLRSPLVLALLRVSR
jgi:hypothetical protein